MERASAYEQQVVVRGEAEAQAAADVADLTVRVRVDAPTQGDAFAAASELATAVDTVLDHRDEALGTRQAATVVVRPTTRWHDGEEQATGWRAERSTTVEVTDLAAIGPMLAELVGVGAIIEGPRWRLRPGHQAVAAARAAAAEDARARAASYAGALGIELGRVLWVAEPGLRGGEPVLHASRAMAVAAEAGGMEVPPAELAVHAAVDVAFAIGR